MAFTEVAVMAAMAVLLQMLLLALRLPGVLLLEFLLPLTTTTIVFFFVFPSDCHLYCNYSCKGHCSMAQTVAKC